MFAIFETSSCLLVLLTNGKLLFCTVRKVISPTLGTSDVVGGSDYTFQPIVVRNSMRCCRKSARDRRRFAVKTRAHTTKRTLPIGRFPGGEFSHHRMTSPWEENFLSKVNNETEKKPYQMLLRVEHEFFVVMVVLFSLFLLSRNFHHQQFNIHLNIATLIVDVLCASMANQQRTLAPRQ